MAQLYPPPPPKKAFPGAAALAPWTHGRRRRPLLLFIRGHYSAPRRSAKKKKIRKRKKLVACPTEAAFSECKRARKTSTKHNNNTVNAFPRTRRGPTARKRARPCGRGRQPAGPSRSEQKKRARERGCANSRPPGKPKALREGLASSGLLRGLLVGSVVRRRRRLRRLLSLSGIPWPSRSMRGEGIKSDHLCLFFSDKVDNFFQNEIFGWQKKTFSECSMFNVLQI